MGQLTPRQQICLRSLIEGRTVTEAAKCAQVSSKTAFRWLQQEAFIKALRDCQGKSMDTSMLMLQGACHQATETLLALLKDGNSWLRFSVSQVILDRAMKANEQLRIIERLERLEQQVSPSGRGKKTWA